MGAFRCEGMYRCEAVEIVEGVASRYDEYVGCLADSGHSREAFPEGRGSPPSVGAVKPVDPSL